MPALLSALQQRQSIYLSLPMRNTDSLTAKAVAVVSLLELVVDKLHPKDVVQHDVVVYSALDVPQLR
jgi:hypothetical protein